MKLTETSLCPLFGARLEGIDLRGDRSPEVMASIEEALDRSAVVALPGQFLTDDDQLAVSELLGDLSKALNPGRAKTQATRLRAELYDISNLDENSGILAENDRRRQWRESDKLWHTDRSFIDAETSYSLLSARVIPPEGGDTGFADMRAVYDDLPQELKIQLEGLRAEHSVWYSRALSGGKDFREDELAAMPPVSKPLVRVHPRTGRKSLFVASHASHIVGWPRAEGRNFLDELMAYALQPKYRFYYKWTEGDLVIWDNRCTMHRGTHFDDVKYKRDLRRTTVQGPSKYGRMAAA
jgi:alpha-ketoglutarate-dependent 2,4-dichlorophenoxyacetate dioxygenase